MTFPSAPIHLSDNVRSHVQLTLDRLSANELHTFWEHLVERSSNGGPVLGGPAAPSEIFSDTQLTADINAIVGGPLFSAELVSLGWTAP